MKIGEIWFCKDDPIDRIRLARYNSIKDSYLVEVDTDREHEGFECWFTTEMSRKEILEEYLPE